MDDTISRRAAIDVLVNESSTDGAYGYVDIKSIVRLLNGLPPAQPEDICGECDAWNQFKNYPRKPQWIPVSKRLPEKPKNYPYCEIRRTYYLVSLESGCVKTLGYEFDRDEWQITGSPVVAWMPLPMPWGGSEA